MIWPWIFITSCDGNIELLPAEGILESIGRRFNDSTTASQYFPNISAGIAADCCGLRVSDTGMVKLAGPEDL